MGVPSLYRTLVTNYANIQDVSNEHIEYLFLDFNCLIHHCLKISGVKDVHLREIDECVINEVLRYSIYIITKVVKPTRLVYLAVDGPVPVAKMDRQRSRRFKKTQDVAFSQKTKRKYDMEESSRTFDSNKITPGTVFMSKLTARIKNYITIGAFAQHAKKSSFKVIYSDSNVAGEGEHKIFDFIRNAKTTPKICVYGMDADLIILSMCVRRPFIKLMRESSHIDAKSDSEFSYLDIDVCKKVLYEDYVPDGMRNDLTIDSFVNDFTFYSMLGGNDFVHPIAHCKIRNGGLEKLTRMYLIVYSTLRKNLIIDDEIQYDFLKQLFNRMMDSEDVGVKKVYCNKPYASNEKLTYEREIELYEHSEYTNVKNPFHLFYRDEFTKINFYDHYDSWSEKYNEYFFNGNEKDGVIQYLHSLVWAKQYYQGNTPSWIFSNKHRVAPLVRTIIEHMDESMLRPNFILFQPLTPIEQLRYVMPAHCHKLLPMTLQDFLIDEESPIREYYPNKFKLDAVAGCKNIYSEALLPEIDIDRIRRIVANVPLDDRDIMRNTIVDTYFHKSFTPQRHANP